MVISSQLIRFDNLSNRFTYFLSTPAAQFESSCGRKLVGFQISLLIGFIGNRGSLICCVSLWLLGGGGGGGKNNSALVEEASNVVISVPLRNVLALSFMLKKKKNYV